MFKIGNYEFTSRLILGTGKFKDAAVQTQAIEASGTEALTFAVRRMQLFDKSFLTL